jgi:two-component system, OmpR family, sensor histidine kinase KdpD
MLIGMTGSAFVTHRLQAWAIFQRLIGLLLTTTLVAVVTGGLVLLGGWLTTPTIALIYLLVVLLCTTLWGLTAGIIASISAFLTFNYLFIPPYYTLIVHQAQDIIVLFVFLIIAVVLSQLVGRAKSGLTQARLRENEVVHLYSLSVDLAGVRDPAAIARMLAEKLAEVFDAATVEVNLYSDSGTMTFRSQQLSHRRISAVPVHILPLSAARGALGEVRLWSAHPSGDAETRLLRALVAQGALALERAVLAAAETRATILEESDRLKSALLSSVSHELRTPLVTIKAAAESLRTGAVDRRSDAADELLAALEEEADRLNNLVGDLLNMSRIEAGALKLQRQWNVLTEIVDTSIARLRLQSTDHSIVVDVSEDLPLVPVDHVLMQQVFNNLISNCLKYAPPASDVTVHAEVPPDATSILIEVRNQGPHVPEEYLEHIFDKFIRVTDADRIPGTGLGLSICRGIIEAHGGRIRAENMPGGFAFKFTLPLAWEGHASPHVPTETDRL